MDHLTTWVTTLFHRKILFLRWDVKHEVPAGRMRMRPKRNTPIEGFCPSSWITHLFGAHVQSDPAAVASLVDMHVSQLSFAILLVDSVGRGSSKRIVEAVRNWNAARSCLLFPHLWYFIFRSSVGIHYPPLWTGNNWCYPDSWAWGRCWFVEEQVQKSSFRSCSWCEDGGKGDDYSRTTNKTN